MESKPKAFDKAELSSLDADKVLQQYDVGPVRFAGAPDALYERRMKFDNVVELESANSRERYKAAARAVRDILSERWLVALRRGAGRALRAAHEVRQCRRA